MFEAPHGEVKQLKGQDEFTRGMQKSVKQEIEKHRIPRLKMKDKCCLLTSSIMGCCFPTCCWRKHKKLMHLYDEGLERIDHELDIVKIIKTLRMTRIFMKNSFLTPELKFGIMHSEQNFVNIDLDDDDDGHN